MNGEITIQGVIINTEKIESGVSQSGKQWTKQGAVIQTQERYPRTVYFTMFGDKIPEGGIQVGSVVEVAIEINSREYNGKWYTNVTGYRIQPVAPQPQGYQQPQYPQQQMPQPQPQQPQQPQQAPFVTRDGESLPF